MLDNLVIKNTNKMNYRDIQINDWLMCDDMPVQITEMTVNPAGKRFLYTTAKGGVLAIYSLSPLPLTFDTMHLAGFRIDTITDPDGEKCGVGVILADNGAPRFALYPDINDAHCETFTLYCNDTYGNIEMRYLGVRHVHEVQHIINLHEERRRLG